MSWMLKLRLTPSSCYLLMMPSNVKRKGGHIKGGDLHTHTSWLEMWCLSIINVLDILISG